MRCLILSNCIFVFFSCTSVYKNLQPAPVITNNLLKFKPDYTVALYTAYIEVADKHLSGLLLIKKMPDSSIRMVFSNEMGIKFFDFEFDINGALRIYSVIKKMNKKPVIKILKKDFGLMLMNAAEKPSIYILKDSQQLYYSYPQPDGGINYYITDLIGNKFIRAERASKRKPVTKLIMQNYNNGIPDSINFSHTKFNFTIVLKRIEQ